MKILQNSFVRRELLNRDRKSIFSKRMLQFNLLIRHGHYPSGHSVSVCATAYLRCKDALVLKIGSMSGLVKS